MKKLNLVSISPVIENRTFISGGKYSTHQSIDYIYNGKSFKLSVGDKIKWYDTDDEKYLKAVVGEIFVMDDYEVDINPENVTYLNGKNIGYGRIPLIELHDEIYL